MADSRRLRVRIFERDEDNNQNIAELIQEEPDAKNNYFIRFKPNTDFLSVSIQNRDSEPTSIIIFKKTDFK